MKIFPAIDLRGGQVVRLTQGDYDKMTVYGTDPAAQAEAFRQAGASCLHLVDLDGAKDGAPVNLEAIRAIARQNIWSWGWAAAFWAAWPSPTLISPPGC